MISPTIQNADATPPASELNLRLILGVIRRRRLLIVQILLLILIASGLVFVGVSRRYRAEARLQLVEQGGLVKLIDSSAGSDDTSSVVQLSVTMETYSGVLASDRLALEVIQELGLENAREYKGGFSLPWSHRDTSEDGRPLAQTRYRRARILQRFARNLQVSSVPGSKLMAISFSANDPLLAKQVLSHLIADFIAYNQELVAGQSGRNTQWLDDQLAGLRDQASRAEAEAVQLQQQLGVFGNDQTRDLVSARLGALQEELTAAEENRIVKGAIVHAIATNGSEAISNLSGNGGQSATPSAVNSLALIQALRQQEAGLSSQLAEITAKYGSNYPRVLEGQSELASVRASIHEETERMKTRASSDYDAAVEQEASIKNAFTEEKKMAGDSNDTAIKYVIANNEATSDRQLYEHLMEKVKEGDFITGISSPYLRVLDEPHVGGSPSSPSPVMYAGFVMFAGPILALCVAFLVDSLDDHIYSSHDLMMFRSYKILGSVPRSKVRALRDGKNGIGIVPMPLNTSSLASRSQAPHGDSEAKALESFRMVRTMLKLQMPARGIILVTSAHDDEGKTRVVASLAHVLAQQGNRVLVVDTDLRRRSLSTQLGLSAEPGLTDSFGSKLDYREPPRVSRPSGSADVVPAGNNVINPSDLFSTNMMDEIVANWTQAYDYILLDSSPLLQYSDSAALAKHADGIVLVCRAGITKKKSLAGAIELVNSLNVRILGLIPIGLESA
jgi:succinoglycan biosynthesis transport protein ExoP